MHPFLTSLMSFRTRYLAEVASADMRKAASDAALKAYSAAQDIAVEHLATTHPIRFGGFVCSSGAINFLV